MTSNGIVPVHFIRRGPLSRNTGGPIRVISDLLDIYAKQKPYAQFGFVSVNSSTMHNGNGKSASSNRTDSPLKHNLGRRLNTSNTGLYIQLRRDAIRLQNKLRNTACDGRIIHSHDQIASGLAFGVQPPPNVLTIHSKGSILNDVKLKAHPQIRNTWMQRVFQRLERNAIRNADVVTFPSQGAMDLFDADVPGILKGKDVRIVYNGVDMERFPTPAPTRTDKEDFTILSVCALVEEKRFDRTIDIAEALHRRGLPFRLIHVGDGMLRDSITENIHKRKLTGVINLKGRLQNNHVLEVQQQAHVFLLPSDRVVFDIATLEAMANGLPAVLSYTGGNREMFVTGKEGFLCTPNSIDAYVACLEGLMKNESLRYAAGQQARNTVRSRFTMDTVVQEFDAIYRDVLSRTKSSKDA